MATPNSCKGYKQERQIMFQTLNTYQQEQASTLPSKKNKNNLYKPNIHKIDLHLSPLQPS